MTTKEFDTLDVVTVATGILVSKNGIGSVYKVCGFMLQDEGIMTHQLPGASRACEAHIYRQHPWIKDVSFPEGDLEAILEQCDDIVEEHGETVTLSSIDPEESSWIAGNALIDLLSIFGNRA